MLSFRRLHFPQNTFSLMRFIPVRRLVSSTKDRFHHVFLGNSFCDRHNPKKVFLTCETILATGHVDTNKYTYEKLGELSKKFAKVLKKFGVGKGARVAIMLPKRVEVIISALAVWRLGAIYVPLFTAFGTDAIDFRVSDSECHVIITESAHVHKIPHKLKTTFLNVINVDGGFGILPSSVDSSSFSFWELLNESDTEVEENYLCGDDPFVLLYTSGTTGNPKGVLVPVKAIGPFEDYLHLSLGVEEDSTSPTELFWNLADPGWAYGLYYNLIAPMSRGVSCLYVNSTFSPKSIYSVFSRHHVKYFTAAPTAYNVLRGEWQSTVGR
eukprot:TRINITY_DN8330_c0_g1_i12.p1 TRINITY_DN8330_c0_g1~~TRINITY_DN8330_c0_g1_i12.p1  ORF type:complete len:357 (-),score=64.97 TRINITY_DN8330_c0_g1_i12:950-1924(-)